MAKKQSEFEQVKQYMDTLEHPMKGEMEALRMIIREANPQISERIKWNAPSYYYKEDIVTFGPPARKMDEILLVFHHPSVVKITSGILKGNYKDRRLATFKNMAEVEANRQELGRILHEIIQDIESATI
ncbi:MAG: DUF1801 domain-containing protein [Saprospiraceae bacterium]|nr:DUF1801 domain-containing protein [Saprospiraceae bacterium]